MNTTYNIHSLNSNYTQHFYIYINRIYYNNFLDIFSFILLHEHNIYNFVLCFNFQKKKFLKSHNVISINYISNLQGSVASMEYLNTNFYLDKEWTIHNRQFTY